MIELFLSARRVLMMFIAASLAASPMQVQAATSVPARLLPSLHVMHTDATTVAALSDRIRDRREEEAQWREEQRLTLRGAIGVGALVGGVVGLALGTGIGGAVSNNCTAVRCDRRAFPGAALGLVFGIPLGAGLGMLTAWPVWKKRYRDLHERNVIDDTGY